MTDQDPLAPPEGTERKYRITDDGKLAEREDADEQEFEEMNFDG